MVDTSLADTGCAAAYASTAPVSASVSRIAVSDETPCGSSSPRASTCSTDGASGNRPRTMPRWSCSANTPALMNSFGSVSSMACRSSYVRNCTGSGVRIAPTREAARYTTTSSTTLGSCTMTTSSRPTPASSSALASRSTAVLSSAYVRRRGSPPTSAARFGGSTTATASGVRRAFSRKRSARVFSPHQPRAVYSAMRSGDSRIITPPGVSRRHAGRDSSVRTVDIWGCALRGTRRNLAGPWSRAARAADLSRRCWSAARAPSPADAGRGPSPAR